MREALTRATDQLAANPLLSPTALADAAMLLMHQLGVERATLRAHPERLLDREQLRAYQGLVERRLRFEPMQYIVGEQEFFGLALKVTPAVLIPRPETELLVEAVLARLETAGPVRVVDVGTGSGAIAIALAHAKPEMLMTAVDLSREALAVAAENVARHGLGARVRLVESDLLGGVSGEDFDVIVSNPPYIPSGDVVTMHPQVPAFEPHTALFAGEDGLEVYRRLIPQAWGRLRGGGVLAMEIGFGQEEALRGLLGGWSGVEVLKDLQGIARVVVGSREGKQHG